MKAKDKMKIKKWLEENILFNWGGTIEFVSSLRLNNICNSTVATACFIRKENKIYVKQTHCYTSTIAHEIAHMVQYYKLGTTDCYSTHYSRRNVDLANQHSKLQDKYRRILVEIGYKDLFHSICA